MSDDEHYEEEGWDEEEPSLGPRRAALARRRRRARKRRTLFGTSLIVIGVAAAAAVTIYAAREVIRPDDAPQPTEAAPASRSTTLLLFGTKERDSGSQMIWADLIVRNGNDGTGAAIYIPGHTAVEVPGRGLLALKDAYEGGGIPLLLVTAENLLGITIDNYLQLTDGDAGVLLDEVAPLDVEVPVEVRVSAGRGSVRIILSEGFQRLSRSLLTHLLYTVGVEGDDVELGTRHIAFWDALFDAYEDDPQGLIDAVEAAGGSLGKTDASPRRVGTLLGDLAALTSSTRTLVSLPVESLEVPGNRLYVPDDAAVAELVAQVVGESTQEEQVRVQILNGNGAPGIGQKVAERLVGEGFRVILSGNAKRLDYETTLVIAYDDTTKARQLADLARELLGVGEVRISTQDQGIVDLTIVVGKDFLRSQ